jgi:hypothetical protein
MNSIAFIQID